MLRNNEPVTGTWFVAQGFQREHKVILKLIRKYQANFENFGTLEVHKFKSTGGRPVEEFLLSEPQFSFLGTLFRNNEQVVNFKEALIKEFYRMKTEIIRAKTQHKDPEWIETRQKGKEVRLITTDTMQEFEAYATGQDSTNANMYYMNITKMMNGLLFIVNGKFKNLRDLMTPRQLLSITAAEYIIDKALKDGMRDKMYYKDIYKLVRDRVQTYADLHGQSEVISRQLSLFNIDSSGPEDKR